MPTLIHRRVAECRNGTNPKTICRVESGWVVLGDVQFVRGYSLLLPDPVVPDLNALRGDGRAKFLSDMTAIGDALLEITNAKRINYEILGNLEPALHAHVFPRYDDEDESLRTRPVWFYDWDNAPQFNSVAHAEMMTLIRDKLVEQGTTV